MAVTSHAKPGARAWAEVGTLTLVRVVAGIIMTAHGWQKLTDIPGWQQNLAQTGVPAPEVLAYFAIAGEFLGGIGLILGLLTPLAAFGVACVMAVAIVAVHLPHGLFAANNGFEYPLTMLALNLYFMARGGGPISLDARIRRGPRHSRSTMFRPPEGHEERRTPSQPNPPPSLWAR
jgi:putative oxidoreductase